ncbi:MAG: hypothetical protein AAB897_03215 [Patescibacteria group bacterium]
MIKIQNRFEFVISKIRICLGFGASNLGFPASGGYIALVSALVITAIIILVVATIGYMAFFGRAGSAGAHYKERSRALAEACVSTALLKLASSSYTGNETINVASNTCRIFTIVSTSTGRIVDAQGIFQRSYTNYRITVPTSTVSIISWEELKAF